MSEAVTVSGGAAVKQHVGETDIATTVEIFLQRLSYFLLVQPAGRTEKIKCLWLP